MVRETRGSAAARGAATHPSQSPDSGSKRKRRSSDASAAPSDANGETPDSKRLRASMNGKGSADTIAEEEDVKPRPGRLLTKEIREAIAVVLSQMAAGLPSPINKVLTLWLPPDFTQKEENTLGWILKQDSLTWEKLVSIIHLFSEHLLLPCAYPNPVPSLARFHLPVPPLPSHFPPLTVHTFCRTLHQLLLQVEAQIDATGSVIPDEKQERWALMQKTPGNGLGTAGGDWFTAAADLREVEAARKKLDVKNGNTLLGTLASGGDKFGNAQPLVVQATEPLGSEGKGNVPTLSDSIIRRASLKAQRWKESLAARRKSGFGSVLHPTTVPKTSSAAFTPTFGPLYDSLSATSLGYYSTLDLMHERRRKHLHAEITAKIVAIDEEDGFYGILDKETNGDEEDKEQKPTVKLEVDATDDVLAVNARRIAELQAWQEVRVIKGDAEWISDREQAVAEELFASLARLVDSSDTPPSALLPENVESGTMGLAHTLARRLLSNRAPIIRGTLDPRRPQALHDNVTIRLRAQAAAAIVAPSPSLGVNGTMATPHAPPPKVSPGTPSGFMPPPSSTIREPPPHTLPSNSRYYSHGRAPYPVPSQQVQRSPHAPPQQLTPNQQLQPLPSHQMGHQSPHGMAHQGMTHQQAQVQAQVIARQQAMATQAQQAMQMQQQQMQNVMVPAGHMYQQAAMMGMPAMQGYAHGSPQQVQQVQQVQHQQVYRPQSAGMAYPQHMASPYAHAQGVPGMGGSQSPSPMAGYPQPQQQRMMMAPSGLRQAYPIPQSPGTPGTPGAGMPMQMYAQPSYGSPMPVRVAGMPGVPMMGGQMQGGMPGQQVMHR